MRSAYSMNMFDLSIVRMMGDRRPDLTSLGLSQRENTDINKGQYTPLAEQTCWRTAHGFDLKMTWPKTPINLFPAVG
ncbi:MAG TPA: hypothetical protein VFQ91_26920 [Bryobacteraceae bacterium]|nr:hypothetical protein [Bryobacteraceae bacterium]